jgi:protein prenyltransferase alpha subunit repeat containing protein 1
MFTDTPPRIPSITPLKTAQISPLIFISSSEISPFHSLRSIKMPLDPEKARALQSPVKETSCCISTSSADYLHIIQTLTPLMLEAPHQLEILPPSFPLPAGTWILTEGTTIGMPKTILLSAFTHAREAFFSRLPLLRAHGKSVLESEERKHDFGSLSDMDIDVLLSSSMVILLVDPEHLTAANARKRILMLLESDVKPQQISNGCQMTGGWAGSTEIAKRNVFKDLWFCELLLCSRAKRHNKSPTLWGHRRWLLRRLEELEKREEERIPGDLMRMKVERDEREWRNVVPLSAEYHPKNYYAWDHLRWWLRRQSQLESQLFEATITNLDTLIPFFTAWALTHISDTSGFSFLFFLLTLPTVPAFVRSTTASKVLDRAIGLDLRNESLWVFLRTLAQWPDMDAAVMERIYGELGTVVMELERRAREEAGEEKGGGKGLREDERRWLKIAREARDWRP